MTRKLTIFISSTKHDLEAERSAVIDALTKMKDKYETEAMEFWVSSDEEPKGASLDRLKASHVYIGIIGFFYCSRVDPETGKSLTQLEYELAKKLDMPRLVFIKDEDADVKKAFVEQDPEKVPKLQAFVGEIKSERLISHFRNADQLATLVVIALEKHLGRQRATYDAFDVYEPEDFEKLRNSLRFNPLAAEVPIARDAVSKAPDHGRILVNGMPGSGKTTAVLMLCVSLKPDRIIVIKSCTLLQSEIEELLDVVKRGSRLLLIWDDVDRLFEYGQGDVFPTIVGKCEEIHGADTIMIATCRSTRLALLKGYPSDLFWRKFRTVTLDRMTEAECLGIVKQFADLFKVQVPSKIREKLIETILRREDTPLYAVSLLRENAGKELSLDALDETPASVKEIWAEAARTELSNAEVDLLRVLKLFRDNDVPVFIDVSQAIYYGLDPRRPETFDAVATSLGEKKWIERNDVSIRSLDSQLESLEKGLVLSPDQLLGLLRSRPVDRYHAALSLLAFGVQFGFRGEEEEAITCLDESLRIAPSESAWYNKGVALVHLGRYEEALAVCNKAIKIEPHDEDAWINKGIALANLNRYVEALSCFDEAIKLKPDHAIGWFNKGTYLTELKRYEESLKAIDEAIKLKPDYTSAWINKGNILGKLNRHEEALSCFDEAIKLKPDDADSWSNKGVTSVRLGRYQDALEAFDEAIKRRPDFMAAIFNKATTFSTLGRYEEAIDTFDKAIKIKPDYTSAWINKGIALANLNRYVEALSCFDEAIKLKPDDADSWSNRGTVLSELGRYEEALEAFDKAIKIKPDDANSWSNKGVTSVSLGRYQDALKAIDEAIKLKPEDAQAWYRKGLVLIYLNREQEAKAAISQANKLSTGSSGGLRSAKSSSTR